MFQWQQIYFRTFPLHSWSHNVAHQACLPDPAPIEGQWWGEGREGQEWTKAARNVGGQAFLKQQWKDKLITKCEIDKW